MTDDRKTTDDEKSAGGHGLLYVLAAIALLAVLAAVLSGRVISGPLPQARNKVYMSLYERAVVMIEFGRLDGIALEMGEFDKDSDFLRRLDRSRIYIRHMRRGEFLVLSRDVASGGERFYIGMRGGRMDDSKTREQLARLTKLQLIGGVKNARGEPYDGGPLFMIEFGGE